MVKSSCVDQNGMMKGAWSEEEDNKLRAYVQRYGHWNWRQLPKFAGLRRCGKSCRLRWLNYLKPGVRRGNYTPQEENLIFELYQKFGSKWSVIAAQLPGRVDNDIKNHWNGQLRRKMKFQTPIHEEETRNNLRSQVMNQNEVESDSSSMSDSNIGRESSLRYDSTLLLQDYAAADEDIYSTLTESDLGCFWPQMFASSHDGNDDLLHLQFPAALEEEKMGLFTSYLDEINMDYWLHELFQFDN